MLKRAPDALSNQKPLPLLRLRTRHPSPHRMVPGGREPLARPPQDPLLAFHARLAERRQERLLQAASQDAPPPLVNPSQPPPAPRTPTSAAPAHRLDPH